MIPIKVGRPGRDEAPIWSFAYIDLVQDDDPLAVLKAQRQQCRLLFSSISEEQSLARCAPGKWSIRDIVRHLSDAERTFCFRAFWFARNFHDPLPDFDQDVAAPAAEADCTRWLDLIEEFDNVRQATLCFFTHLSESGWRREGIASGQRITVRAIAYLIPGHVAHHLQVLRDRYR